MRKNSYTLIELVAVVLIIALVTGIVVGQRNRVPAFVSLENTARELQLFFSRASLMATSQGKIVIVSTEPSSGVFVIGGASEVSSVEAGTMSYKLPPCVQIEGGQDGTSYRFFPDGTGSGPTLELSLKGHRIRIKISKLTGMAGIERDK
ncbi:MAG TPA: hypothetical protein DCZ94_10915 [Lentisphaeria bacterium]|nr:MAG: hypothetical protein A2X48_06795 [Lentisphaerae bacterium GWF2_49_21]HBC87456.1 hypothetical protein [Lentisphaeria bacterium]